MNRPLIAALSLAVALSAGAAAQAQIKTGFPPKARSVIEAERAEKAEREAAKKMAQAAERGHAHAFDRLDADKNGRLSYREFKDARLDHEAEARAQAQAETARR